MNVRISQHANRRIRQRGLRERDIGVVLEAGSPVDDCSVMLLRRDVDQAIAARKREIATLERLRGCRVVLQAETLVTVYRPTRRTEKRLLRHG